MNSRDIAARLMEMFDEIRKMPVTPFGLILDFLIEQGLTKEQAISRFEYQERRNTK